MGDIVALSLSVQEGRSRSKATYVLHPVSLSVIIYQSFSSRPYSFSLAFESAHQAVFADSLAASLLKVRTAARNAASHLQAHILIHPIYFPATEALLFSNSTAKLLFIPSGICAATNPRYLS